MMFFKYTVVVNQYLCFMAVCLGRQLSKSAARISEPFVKCSQRHAYCKNIRKYAIFTKFYEFMLQKVLKFSNYDVAVLV